MTREEAIDIIKCLAWHTRPDEEDVEQAIKVLEQQPCDLGDAREDFMHDVYNTLDFLPTNNEANRIIDSFDRVTRGLNQQPCADYISRNDIRTINTDGLEEGIRCAMCTNPMANDRGCDGGCVVNESMYQNVLNVIKKQISEQQPCDDCISRKEVLDKIYNVDGMEALENSNIFAKHYADMVKSLPPVTPKQQTCEDAISRQDALNCVTSNEFRYRMVEDIKALPPVAPQPKTAHWINKTLIYKAETEGERDCYAGTCSACGEVQECWNYCSGCGARMVSE